MAVYHCVLFDLDGTLLDFTAAEHGALMETLEHFNLPATEKTEQTYRTINEALWASLERGGIRQDKLVVRRFEKLQEELGGTQDPVQMNAYYLERLAHRADIYPEVENVLRELAEVATLVVVSNGVEEVQMGRLERAGILSYFDGVFISGKVGASKPSKKIFDAALRSLGIENRSKVLMVGDSLRADVVGGTAAGLDTCWCNFKKSPAPEKEKPTYTITNLEQLFEIVMEEEELANVGNPDKRHQV